MLGQGGRRLTRARPPGPHTAPQAPRWWWPSRMHASSSGTASPRGWRCWRLLMMLMMLMPDQQQDGLVCLAPPGAGGEGLHRPSPTSAPLTSHRSSPRAGASCTPSRRRPACATSSRQVGAARAAPRCAEMGRWRRPPPPATAAGRLGIAARRSAGLRPAPCAGPCPTPPPLPLPLPCRRGGGGGHGEGCAHKPDHRQDLLAQAHRRGAQLPPDARPGCGAARAHPSAPARRAAVVVA